MHTKRISGRPFPDFMPGLLRGLRRQNGFSPMFGFNFCAIMFSVPKDISQTLHRVAVAQFNQPQR